MKQGTGAKSVPIQAFMLPISRLELQGSFLWVPLYSEPCYFGLHSSCRFFLETSIFMFKNPTKKQANFPKGGWSSSNFLASTVYDTC